MAEQTYPGEEQINQLMIWAQPKLDSATKTAGDFKVWISSNWSNTADSVDVITFGNEFEKRLDIQVEAALLSAKDQPDYAERLKTSTIDSVKHDLRIATLRNQLGGRGQQIFDALMRNDVLNKLADKYAAETGTNKFREELNEHPDVVAYAIAKNAELGTGRLDSLVYQIDAMEDVWDKSKGWKISENQTFTKIFDWCKDIPVIGTITEFIRWAANAIDYIPQTVTFVSKVCKQFFGGGDPDYQAALEENRFEAAQGRVKDSLVKSGLSTGLAADIAGIVRNPASAADIQAPPPTTLPKPQPHTTEPDKVADTTVADTTAAAVSTGQLGEQARTKPVTPPPENTQVVPIRTPVRHQLGKSDGNIEFVGFDVDRTKSAKAWGIFATQSVMAAPLTTYLGDLSAARDPANYSPSTRFEGAKFITSKDAIAALDDENSPLYKRLIGEINGRTLTAGSLSRVIFDQKSASDASYTPQQAQDETVRLLSEERRALQTTSTQPLDRDKPVQFSFLVNHPDKSLPGYDEKTRTNPGMLIASDFGITSQAASYMTLSERISDERRVGILAFKKMKDSPPQELADAIVGAMLDQKPLSARLDQLREQGVNPNSFTALPAVTQDDLNAYLTWEKTHVSELEGAYDRKLGNSNIAQSRRFFANSEVAGIQNVMDNAIKEGKLHREDLTPELLTFYTNQTVKSDASPAEFSNVPILSTDALNRLDHLYSENDPKGLRAVQTPKDIADSRTKMVGWDAMVLVTATEQYNAFPGHENDHRKSNINDVLTFAKSAIENNGSDKSTPIYNISLPNADSVNSAPLMTAYYQSLNQQAEEAARLQALEFIQMDKQERARFERELRERHKDLVSQLESRRGVSISNSTTAVGAKIEVADVDSSIAVNPNAPRTQGGPSVPQLPDFA